jgi:hypothetical protein
LGALLSLSPQKNREEFQNGFSGGVENAHRLPTVPRHPLPIPTSEWRFPHLEDAFFGVFGRNCGGDLRKKRFSQFCLKVQ